VEKENGDTAGTVPLFPLRGARGEAWQLRLDDGLCTLLSPEGRTVLMLPREEAPWFLRSSWWPHTGWVIEFRALGGLKRHRFRAPRASLRELLDWLPHPPPERFAAQRRHNAAWLILLAILAIAYPGIERFAIAVPLLLAVVLNLANPQRWTEAMNAALLLLGALLGVFSPLVFNPPAGWDADTFALGGMLFGTLAAFAAIEQARLIGPNFWLRLARMTPPADSPDPGSELVRRTVYTSAAAGGAFLLYAAALVFATPGGAAPPISGFLNDAVLFGGLGLLFLALAGYLWPRRPAAYRDALLTGQLLIAVLAFYGWGFAGGIADGQPVLFTSGILSQGLLSYNKPYLILPLLALVVLYRRWFTLIAEREQEQEH